MRAAESDTLALVIDERLLTAALKSAGACEPLTAVTGDLAKAFSCSDVPRGAPVLMQGEVWNQAMVIGKGLVRMHFLRRDGKEFNKNFFTEGALICPLTPEMMMRPSLFGITAVEATTIWRCDANAFQIALAAQGLWEPLRRELLTRLLSAKLQREHDLLALDGRKRYEAFCERFPTLAERVPLMHLATYLGITDVSLSRLRRRRKEPEAR